MNKGLMLAALAVLLCGSAFAAITNVTDTVEGTTGKYVYTYGTANTTTEGGNVTEVNLTSNSSTEKWAGFYGNVSGYLLLAQSYTLPAMYVWTWSADSGGEVCASVGSDFAWASLATETAADIDTTWGFTATDSDSAANTFTDASASYDVNGQTGTTTGVNTYDNTGTQDWETFALNDGGGNNKADIAFCVNMSDTNTFAVGGTGAYQLMVPTDEAFGAFETYFFYVELE